MRYLIYLKSKKKKYIEKDEEARAEFEKQKKEGEQRSIETGKQSQKKKLYVIGGKHFELSLWDFWHLLSKTLFAN